jgi:protocatechuate 3,4-dioxygenase beta subunit
MKIDRRLERDGLTRRAVLSGLMGAGAGTAFGCGNTASELASSASSGTTESSRGAVSDVSGDAALDASRTPEGAAAAECAVTPEGEIGPYFADDSDARFNRSNVLSNLDGTNTQAGIPLTLTVIVLDSGKSCAPYANAQVDIWHCNSAGIYSDQSVENTLSDTWLRGYQITDEGGRVTFSTIVPGWYAGRTTHIHLRVRSSYSSASSTNDGTNTTQLFFDQTLIDSLATSVIPYSAEGQNPTTNASDHVYDGETDGANLLTLSGDDSTGYTAAVTLHLPITSEGTSTPSGEAALGAGSDDGGGFGGPAAP